MAGDEHPRLAGNTRFYPQGRVPRHHVVRLVSEHQRPRRAGKDDSRRHDACQSAHRPDNPRRKPRPAGQCREVRVYNSGRPVMPPCRRCTQAPRWSRAIPGALTSAHVAVSGEVAEWSNALDSKSSVRFQRTVGSNPTLSARILFATERQADCQAQAWDRFHLSLPPRFVVIRCDLSSLTNRHHPPSLRPRL